MHLDTQNLTSPSLLLDAVCILLSQINSFQKVKYFPSPCLQSLKALIIGHFCLYYKKFENLSFQYKIR